VKGIDRMRWGDSQSKPPSHDGRETEPGIATVRHVGKLDTASERRTATKQPLRDLRLGGAGQTDPRLPVV
jgi:hypothetical protein